MASIDLSDINLLIGIIGSSIVITSSIVTAIAILIKKSNEKANEIKDQLSDDINEVRKSVDKQGTILERLIEKMSDHLIWSAKNSENLDNRINWLERHKE